MTHANVPALEIGRLIRRFRTRAGLTQTKLAAMSGITVNYLGLLERGTRTPSLDVLAALAKSLGCRVRNLIPF